jgi:hypothetical protein
MLYMSSSNFNNVYISIYYMRLYIIDNRPLWTRAGAATLKTPCLVFGAGVAKKTQRNTCAQTMLQTDHEDARTL